jgi:hypothetical protein
MDGYNPLFLITRRIVSIYIRFIRFGCSSFHVSISPSFLRVQTKVHIGPAFMGACITEYLELIRQYVKEDREDLHNSTMCLVKTLLLVSSLLNHVQNAQAHAISQLTIEPQNLPSIQYHLEAGADSNMGADERMSFPFLYSSRYWLKSFIACQCLLP